MTPADYKSERELRGTQLTVAAQLQISRITIARRETGALPISREAELALLSIPRKRNKKVYNFKDFGEYPLTASSREKG